MSCLAHSQLLGRSCQSRNTQLGIKCPSVARFLLPDLETHQGLFKFYLSYMTEVDAHTSLALWVADLQARRRIVGHQSHLSLCSPLVDNNSAFVILHDRHCLLVDRSIDEQRHWRSCLVSKAVQSDLSNHFSGKPN